MIIDQNKYAKEYDEKKFWNKLVKMPKAVGREVIFKAIVLFVILSSKETPLWVKILVIAALGYFVCPVDMVPDVVPFVGYLDDLGVFTLLMGEIAAFNTTEVKKKARQIERNMYAGKK